jgi:Na+/H+-dicarboxylate symporter
MRMPLAIRVLIGLVAGLVAGVVISLTPSLAGVTPVVEPAGALFINAIRMTVIPLVMSSLVVGICSTNDTRAIGRVGGRALVVFGVVLFAGAVFAAVVGAPLLARLPVSAESSAMLRAAADSTGLLVEQGASQVPTTAQWIVSLAPSNPIRAAADGAMLPLIIFTVVFALALLRVPAERRAPVVGFFHGVFDAMLVLVRWVLVLAPVGVFALALPLAARLGISAAGAVAYYVGLVALLSILFGTLVLYPAAALLGGVSLGEFARAAAPAQAVAFSSRSSLAALPVMMESAATRLGLPAEVSSFFLPLAASVFRAGAGVGITFGVLFVARLYGVTLGPAQLAAVIVTVVLTSFSIPGIPAGSILVMVPVMMAAGIPVAGIGILLGVDTIPDMFRTTLNVTGQMSAATLVARRARVPAAPPVAPSEPAISPDT